MNAQERRERTLRIARERGDRAAVAIIEGGRRHTPEPPDYAVTRLPSVWRDTTWRAA